MDHRLQRRLISCAVPFTVLLTILLGCGRNDGPTRVAADGEVTFRGQPVEKGSILFIPTAETRGPRTGAVIEAGQYHLSRDRGPVIGQLRVEIRAERELGYDITEPSESVQHIGESLPPNDIPLEYNDRSILVVEATADGTNSFDFHLPRKQ